MALNLGEIAAGAIVSQIVSKSMNSDENKQKDAEGTQIGADDARGKRPTEDPAKQLLELERRNRPTEKALDGFYSTTFTVPDGQRAEVRIQPKKGKNLRVKRLAFDRQNGFDYTFLVGGEQFGGSHRKLFEAPRIVRHGNEVVCIAENNSGNSATFDFEGDMWGIPITGGP